MAGLKVHATLEQKNLGTSEVMEGGHGCVPTTLLEQGIEKNNLRGDRGNRTVQRYCPLSSKKFVKIVRAELKKRNKDFLNRNEFQRD